MNDISERIANLSPEKRALLEQRLLQPRANSVPAARPGRRREVGRPPLSFAQQRLWFLDQLEPGSASFNVCRALRLRGTLDTPALQQALDTIVARHEAIRTTFAAVDGEPVQVIAENVTVDLPLVDLMAPPAAGRAASLANLLRDEARRPFDLSRDLMLRTKLIRLDEEEHILLIVKHHIASDAWSAGIFMQELATLYEALVTGCPAPLPELPIQYADFAVWQRRWLQGETLARQLVYWKTQLADSPPSLELPVDRPRPATQTFRGAEETALLPPTLLDSLKALSRSEGATLFMTLLAAFKVLLYRYSGQSDVVVGSPIAGRKWVETEPMIGFFLNTLVLRTDLSGEPDFRELLRRVRATALAAYAHQDLPFEKLVEELHVARNLSHTPLFQVMFILQNAPRPPLAMAGLTLESVKVDTGATPYELTLAVTELPEGLRLQLEYNTDLFDRATIGRLLGHYQMLLAGIVADPERPISRLPLLTEAERDQLLYTWNETRQPYSYDTGVMQLFEAQVALRPQATAFIEADHHLSYLALNRRATQVAHALRALGAGPGTVVGLCLERSLEAVIAFLGVFKAGCVYLPLDPAYPPARLAFMLTDTGAPIVVTQRDLLPTLADGSNFQPLCLDDDSAFIDRQSEENPGCYAEPDDLAYIIYTSGSTGRPKGVAVPQRQILNRLLWMWEAYPFASGEVGCQKTALNFVDSLWELFGPLLQGVPSVIVPDAVLKEPAALVETLAAHEVSRLWFVPSFLRVLLDTFPDLAQRLPKLTFWVTSGEAISWELYHRFQVQMPHSTLYNLYGTSEVWDVTWYTLDRAHQALPHVPIGRPIANMTTYILDEQRQPVPIGVPGELVVGGVGLGHGYLNRPELTAEKFIPNPFVKAEGRRQKAEGRRRPSGGSLYKTGDRARFLPDGNIEFLGRQDYQLKIRGYRIEPGEIETILNEHPAVKEAAIVARAGTADDQQLVAYVVAQPGVTVAGPELRRALQEKLPGYMVPATFVVLEKLPLTPSGKVDRRALPAPDRTQLPLEAGFVAPRDDGERRLAQIWAEVLGLDAVGVHDNFFDLGGHSLLAVRLFARIEAEFGPKLPLATLFQSPTVAQLLPALGQQDSPTAWSTSRSSLVAIQPQGSRPPFFCVHGVGGHVLRYQALARYLGLEQPFYGLQSRGLDEKHAPHDTIEAMAAHYVEAIQSLQADGPYLLGGLSLGGFVALEMARQLWAEGQPVALLALFDTRATQTPGYFSALSRTGLLQYKVNWLRERLRLHREVLAARSPQEGVAYIWQRVKRGKSTPVIDKVAWGFEVPESEPVMQQVLHANRQALSRYVPWPYAGKITLFKAIDSSRGLYYGWNQLSPGGVEVHEVPGGHVGILQEPQVQVLAEKLRECIARAL